MKKRWLGVLLLLFCAGSLYASQDGENKQALQIDQKTELSSRLAKGASVSSFNENFLGQSREEDLKIQEQSYQDPVSALTPSDRPQYAVITKMPEELKSSCEFKRKLNKWQRFDSHNPDARHIICMTYNMCDNPYAKVLTDSAVHERYWNAQIASIISLIQDERPHIIGLQGIRQEKEGHVSLLREILSQSGYHLIVADNNQAFGEPLNIIAYRKKYVNNITNKCYWASQTPTMAPGDWESYGHLRPVLVATFYPTLITKKSGQLCLSSSTSCPSITVANVLSGPIRKDCSTAKIDFNHVHVGRMNQLLKQTPGIGLVMGDLTSLEDSDILAEELKVFSNNGFQNITAQRTVSGKLLSENTLSDNYVSAQSKKIKQGAVGQIQCAMRAPSNMAAAYWSYVSTTPCISNAQSLEIFGDIDRKKYPNLPCSNIPTIAYLIVANTKEKPHEQQYSSQQLKPLKPIYLID